MKEVLREKGGEKNRQRSTEEAERQEESGLGMEEERTRYDVEEEVEVASLRWRKSPQ